MNLSLVVHIGLKSFSGKIIFYIKFNPSVKLAVTYCCFQRQTLGKII